MENGSGSDDNNTRVDVGSPVVAEVSPTNEEPQVEPADALEQALKDLSNLEGANMKGANLKGANLEGANLKCLNHEICK